MRTTHNTNQMKPLSENLDHIVGHSFAGSVTENQEIAQLIGAVQNDSTLLVRPDGSIVMGDDTLNGSSNSTEISKGSFASNMTESQEIAQLMSAVQNDSTLQVRPDGKIIMGDDTLNGSSNSTEISKGSFAAIEQWYHTNPALFRAEVAVMRNRFPDAKYRILNSGNMVWLVTLKIGDFCDPWTFVLRYDADHPNNNNYGGSIKVMLAKPDLDELRRRANAAGRRGVPHILSGHTVEDEEFIYLCTRRQEDVNDGRTAQTTAAQVTAWAADWALHFELGLRDKKIWNDWCNDVHFRHLMI